MKYLNELKVIDNQNKAYLLGLLYSDGCISGKQLTLLLKDKEHILKIYNVFKFFNYNERIYKGRKYYYLNKMDEKLYLDIVSNGLLSRKSFDNKELLKIPFYNELTRHFIRGYFDGNGGCTLKVTNNKKSKTQKRVYIYSNSYNFLQEVEVFLNNNNIETSLKKNSDVYKLSIRTKSYKLFFDFLYKDSFIYLDRKYYKMKDILKQKIFIPESNLPKCKHCGSDRVVKNGLYKYSNKIKQVYLCKECNKNFYSAPINSNINSGEGELLED